mmetsp:Transcript_69499/g.226357  ORF Transcript_69499/g.226357 Transcript_69499/m.226357 type:complete len:90 (-) Transcript_69499:1235-1504(-)
MTRAVAHLAAWSTPGCTSRSWWRRSSAMVPASTTGTKARRKYSIERVRLQDRLIDNLCNPVAKTAEPDMLPWVIFTAGAMGAGKGYVAR